MDALYLDEVGLPLRAADPSDFGRIEIAEEFKLYGQHPHCFRCRRDCRQYAAPDSVIVYCPRMDGRRHV